jgi:hypothetical protein
VLLDLNEGLQSFTHLVSEMVTVTLHVSQESLMPHDRHFHLLLVVFIGVTLCLKFAEEIDKGRDHNGR